MSTRTLISIALAWSSLTLCAGCARDSSSDRIQSSDPSTGDAATVTRADAGVGSGPSAADASVGLPPKGPASGDETWIDKAAGLEWDNRDTQDRTEIDLATAKKQCLDLSLAGHDDWHLPNVDELRSLVRNISPIMTHGACTTTVACPDSTTCNVKDPACLGCTAKDKTLFAASDCKLTDADLSKGLCYWPTGMKGACSAYWSSTANPGLFGQAFYYVRFNNGIIRSDFSTGGGAHYARCVRDAK